MLRTIVYLALDLGKAYWELAIWGPDQANASVHRLKNKNDVLKLVSLEGRLQKIRDRYGEDVEIRCCYEASWLGFWLARWLEERGVKNTVISPNSLERGKKKPKTDKIDARMMVRKLKQYHEGDKRAFTRVRVPLLDEEKVRERQRERDKVQKEVHRHRRWLESKLSYYGILGVEIKKVETWEQFVESLSGLKTVNGDATPDELIRAMRRTVQRLKLAEEQQAEVEAAIHEYHESLPETSPAKKLEKLKGFAVMSSQKLDTEIMNWKRFSKAKQIGKFIGLTPTPWMSCSTSREQGIGKDGKPTLRATVIEIAWLWVKWQPQSDLVKKWKPRLDKKGRIRRMTIVALARELVVALWEYVVNDTPIPGAIYNK